MQDIQDQFANRINIILVDKYKGDNASMVERVLKVLKKNSGTTITMPISLFEPVIVHYFQNKVVGSYIVIDPKGKIIAITDAQSLSTENIQSLMDGKPVNFPFIGGAYANYNIPLLPQAFTYQAEGIFVNSSLTGYMGSISLYGPKNDSLGNIVGFSIINRTLGELYMTAYSDISKDNPIIIDETESALLLNPKNEQAKLFTYDLYLPYGKFSEDKLAQFLKRELDLTFGFQLTRSKRSFPCLIIRSNDNTKNLCTKGTSYSGNEEFIVHATKNKIPVYCHHTNSLESFLATLKANDLFKTTQFINEAKFKGYFDLDFPAGFDFNDKGKLVQFLHDKGFDLSEENRSLSCVIFSDKPKTELSQK